MSPCCHGNLCFDRVIENVIKYDLYVKFPRIFVHNVQINAKFCCKKFQWCLPSISNTTPLYLGGPFFRGHAVYWQQMAHRGRSVMSTRLPCSLLQSFTLRLIIVLRGKIKQLLIACHKNYQDRFMCVKVTVKLQSECKFIWTHYGNADEQSCDTDVYPNG